MNQQSIPSLDFPRVTMGALTAPPTLDFVLPGLLAGTVGMICGTGAVGKSFLALHIAQAIACGVPVAGGLWPAPARGRVLVIAGEDPVQILENRLWLLKQTMSPIEIEAFDDLADIRTGAGFDLRLLTKTNSGLVRGPFFEGLLAHAAGYRLALLDPLAFLHDADEIDNGAMTMLMIVCQEICRITGCTIILLHHFSKAGASEDGDNWAAARGASSLTTAVRWQVNLTPPRKKDKEDYKIDPDLAGFWIRVAQVKANYAPPTAARWLHKLPGGLLRFEEMFKVSSGWSGAKKEVKGVPPNDADF